MARTKKRATAFTRAATAVMEQAREVPGDPDTDANRILMPDPAPVLDVLEAVGAVPLEEPPAVITKAIAEELVQRLVQQKDRAASGVTYLSTAFPR